VNRSATLLSTITLLVGVPAWSDDGAITGIGGRISLMDEHPGVALLAEYVHARVDLAAGTANVECVFVLSNQGGEDSVLVGFPERAGGDTGAQPFSSFRSFVDGQEVTCTRVKGDLDPDPLYWWTKKISFAAGETRVISDEYESPLGSSIGDSTGNFASFEYTLWTGSSWAGRIRSASIVLTVAPCGASISEAKYVRPPPLKADPCEYRWHFSEAEPGRNTPGGIHLAWLIPFSEARAP
jgi:hypothetical protein